MKYYLKHFIKKTLIFHLLLFLVCLSIGASEKGDKPISHRVMSCNIRVALPDDSAKGVGWDNRKDVCIEIIKRQNPDIICTQEVINVQDKDLAEAFPAYFSFGFAGPDMDAYPVGYHGIAKNVILFSKERYELISTGNYWLSETPHVAASKSWGTARARHCNWVRLLDKRTGKEFRVMNIHLDHISQEAKEAQIGMILNEASQYQKDFPQLLIGDFNARMENPVVKSITAAGWSDIYAEMHPENPNIRSYHGFKGLHDDSGDTGRIDFIFSFGPIKALDAKMIKDEIGGMYPSDHYFLMADIEIN